jgi:ferredoxin
VDIDPSIIKTNSIGNKLGLGVVNEEDIELLGDSITELINSNFEIPKSKLTDEDGSVAKGVRKLILRKPYIIKEKCVSCGICIDACPLDEKAIFFKNDHPYPIYDYDKCIRCFCCQEMAPNKCIDVKTPLLGKLFLYRQSSK